MARKKRSQPGAKPDPDVTGSDRGFSRRWWMAAAPIGVGATAAAVAGLRTWGGEPNQTAGRSGPTPPGADPVKVGQARRHLGDKGPWGQLEYTTITLEPLEDSLPPTDTFGRPIWFFVNETREAVEARLGNMGVDPSLLGLLSRQGRWESDDDGTFVEPPIEVVLSLPPEVRSRLYAWLARYGPNVMQRTPTPVTLQLLDDPQQVRGLSPEILSLFKRMCYHRANWTLFSDVQALLTRATTPEEQRRVIALCMRVTTFLVRLRVDEHSDLTTIERYWRFPERSKDLRPILRAVARVPGGDALDLAHLLPPMPRKRLYMYSLPDDDPLADKRDCFWTSLNFLNEPSVDDFVMPDKALAALDAHYEMISEASRFGDIVVLFSERQRQPVHAASYLADGLVFTKNGRSLRVPWVVMKKPDMVGYYTAIAPDDSLVERVYRRKA